MFTVEDHGTVALVRGDDNVKEWLREHTDGQWLGGALAVEPRYLEALVDGLYEAGFTYDEHAYETLCAVDEAEERRTR